MSRRRGGKVKYLPPYLRNGTGFVHAGTSPAVIEARAERARQQAAAADAPPPIKQAWTKPQQQPQAGVRPGLGPRGGGGEDPRFGSFGGQRAAQDFRASSAQDVRAGGQDARFGGKGGGGQDARRDLGGGGGHVVSWQGLNGAPDFDANYESDLAAFTAEFGDRLHKSGLNFKKYGDIPVEASGRDVRLRAKFSFFA